MQSGLSTAQPNKPVQNSAVPSLDTADIGKEKEEDVEENLIKLGEQIKWEFCLNPIDENSANDPQIVFSDENNTKIEKFVQNLFRVVKYVHNACQYFSGHLSAITKDSKYQHSIYVSLSRVLYIIYELDVISMKKSDSLVKIIQIYKSHRKQQQQKQQQQQQQQRQHTWATPTLLNPTPVRAEFSTRSRSRIDIGATRNNTNVTPNLEPTQIKSPICVKSTQQSPQAVQPQFSPKFCQSQPSSQGYQPQPTIKRRQTLIGQRLAQPANTSPSVVATQVSPRPKQIISPPLQLNPPRARSPVNKSPDKENEDKGMAELDKLTEWFSAKYPGMCYTRSLFASTSYALNGFIQFCLNVLGDKVMGFSEGFKSQLVYIRGLTFGFFYLFTADCAKERDTMGILSVQGSQEDFYMPQEGIAMNLWMRAEPWISSVPFTPICEGRYNECTTAIFEGVPAMSSLVLNVNTITTRFKASIHQLSAEAVLLESNDITAFLNNVTNVLQYISNTKKVTELFKDIILFLTKIIELTVLLKTTLMIYSTNYIGHKKGVDSNNRKSITVESGDYITNYDKEEDLRWEKLFPPEVIDFVLRAVRDINMFNRALDTKDTRVMFGRLSLLCRKKLGTLIKAMSATSDDYRFSLNKLGMDLASIMNESISTSDANLTKAAIMLINYTSITPTAAMMSGFDQASLDYFMALYGLTRIIAIIESVTDLSIIWFVQETQQVKYSKSHTRHLQGKTGVWTDKVRSAFSADSGIISSLSTTQTRYRKQSIALQETASPEGSTSSGPNTTPTMNGSSPPSTTSTVAVTNVTAAAQDEPKEVKLTQEFLKYIDNIKESWCPLPIIKFSIPTDSAKKVQNSQEGILDDRDYYEKEDLESISANVEMKKGITFANYLTVKLVNKILDEGRGKTAKLSNIDAIYRKAQYYYETYGNSTQNAATEDFAVRGRRLFRCLCRRLTDTSRSLFVPVLEQAKKDKEKSGDIDPTSSIEFFLSCGPSMPVWFPQTYDDTLVDIDTVQLTAFMIKIFESRFQRMINGIDKALNDPAAPVSEQEFWRYMDTYMLEQLSMTLVLDFVGATAKRPAQLESPMTIFSNHNMHKSAWRVLAAMFSNRLHAEKVLLSSEMSRNLVTFIQLAIADNPEIVYTRDAHQNSLLHWASRLPLDDTCNEELFQFLVKRGCNIEGRNCAGETPLLSSNDIKNVVSLVRLGARINAVTIEGKGIADLHPDWVSRLLNELKISALPKKEELIVFDVGISSARVPDYTLKTEQGKEGQEGSCVCTPNYSLATQFLVAAANRTSHSKLFNGNSVYPWLYSEGEAIAAAATAAKTERKKKKGTGNDMLCAEKKLHKECWPLVALVKVEEAAAGKTVLARTGIIDRMDVESLLSCSVLLELYDVGEADSLDTNKIQLDIDRTQAITKFIIGVGSESRSDRASILKYWEEHALPVRIEDATIAGRKFGFKGIGECTRGGDDIYNIFCAAAENHLQRLYRVNKKNKYEDEELVGAEGETSTLGLATKVTSNKDRARIARLIPMLPSDACYDSVKMLVLGHEEAGKTSLLDSLSEKHSWKSFSKAIWKKRSAQTESTIGVKQVPLTIGEVPVNAYDFGGQLEYHAIHEYFLSPYCAIYLVVVDGSKERLTEQLSYWLQLLHSHSKGPRGTCALFVVCTKADVIEKHFCADAVTAKRGFLKNYLSQWPSLSKIAGTEVFMVSNKTGVGIKALHDAIKDRLRILRKTPVPGINIRAMQALSNSQLIFMSFTEFMDFLVEKKILSGNMPQKHSRQICRDILDFLHNSGHAVVSSGYDTICCRPELISDVLSIFVAPSDHLKRLLDIEQCQRTDILTHTELVRRLKCLDEMKHTLNKDKLCEKIISSLEDMKFCYPLHSDEARLAYNLGPVSEQCFIFPSLCETVDFIALPYNEEADRSPYIFHVTCHGYECAGCRSRFTAPKWEPVPPAGVFCPKCVCPEIVHVCLNEPPGTISAFIGSRHQEVRSEYLAVIQGESTNSMWSCLTNDDKAGPKKVQIPRPCQCIEYITPAIKYVSCVIDSMLEQGISMSHFNRIAVQLRRYMHPRFRLFRNFVVFRDIYGNVILATLFMKDRQRALGIISRGTVPHLWVESLHPLLTLGEAVVPTCPGCAHVNTFTPLHAAQQGGSMVCDNGHTVTSEEVFMGLPRNERLCTENALWGPKKAAAFYEESAGKWITDPRYPNVVFTELTATDATPARLAEYIYARSLFYKFVGTDPANSQFTLTKVVFIENKAVEAMFSRKFSEFAMRAYSAANTSSSASQKGGSSKKISADKVEWQQWVMSHLRKFVERVCGNEQINLVGGWHGTINKSAHGIANTNFYMPAENKASKDPGYFGKGVYFTQSPSYGVDYAVFSANVTKSHAKEGTSYDEEEVTPCLVFSWILLGRVYPVTEAADSGKDDSLMGKGCVEGYDSHYVVLPRQQRDGRNNAITKPYNPKSLLDTPGCDEIVVFDKAQILPRYIFYYNKLSDAKHGFLPIEVRDAKIVTLWVDDEINTTEMITLQTYIKKAIPNVAIVTMVSSSELKSWLHQYGQEVEDKIVIITNVFRANDGEANAAWRVINEVRKVAKLKKVPILIHSKKPTEDVQNFAKMKLVYITTDDTGIVTFVKQKKL